MGGRTKYTRAIAVGIGVATLVLTGAVAARPRSRVIEFGSGAQAAEGPFSYGAYSRALKTHVDDRGMVDYRGLKDRRSDLDAFAASVTRLERSEYETWTDAGKIAFWINAYNALTLEAIVDNYPIEASGFLSFRYPKSSIRQIPGVWTKIRFVVMGRKTTLDEIEHHVLRREFNEPRIHMALVCAAMSCPKLRNEPYVAENLDAQLAEQTRDFLAHSGKFQLDSDRQRVRLSAIFKWFGSDFLRAYGKSVSLPRYGDEQGAVLEFISRHLSAADRRALQSGSYEVSHLEYDWSLNEQKPDAPGGPARRRQHNGSGTR